MKMIRAGLAEGEPFIEWREGWDIEHNRWADDVGDVETNWTEIPASLGLGEHVRRIHSAVSNSPNIHNYIDEVPPAILLCWAPMCGYIARELTEYIVDWNMIVTGVADYTYDGDLRIFVINNHTMAGRSLEIVEGKRRRPNLARNVRRPVTSIFHHQRN